MKVSRSQDRAPDRRCRALDRRADKNGPYCEALSAKLEEVELATAGAWVIVVVKVVNETRRVA